MSYLVLARKFRPQTFEEIIGQEHVTRTLQNAISADRVHHAFLFCGARGTGKTTTARVLCKALNCMEGPTPQPCNKCSSCTEITAGNSVDVMEIDGASHTGVDDIRELRENVRYAPSRCRRKIYIIDEVHMLSVSAFNALLKTLEEPPPHVTFMFATTEPHKIPATILSRCQRFDLRRVTPPVLRNHLSNILKQEGFQAEDDALSLLALESGGSVRDSLSLMDQVIAYAGKQTIDRKLTARVLGVTDRSTLTALSSALINADTDGVLSEINNVFEAGWDLVQFAESLVEHLRDLTVLATCKNPDNFLFIGDEEVRNLRKQIQNTKPERLLQFFDAAARTVDETARSEFPKMTLEMNLLEMALSEPLVPIGELTARLERMENRLLRGRTPGRAGGGGGRAQSGSGKTAEKAQQKKNQAQTSRVSAVEVSASAMNVSTVELPGPEAIIAEIEGDSSSHNEPSPPETDMIGKWETIVSMLKEEDSGLSATLSFVHLEFLNWNEQKVEVGLLAERNGFAAERLLEEGGLAKARESACRVLGRPVEIHLRTTDRESLPASSVDGGHSKHTGVGYKPQSAPRSIRDERALRKKKRQDKIRQDAKNHPSVVEVEQVLGGKLKKIDILE